MVELLLHSVYNRGSDIEVLPYYSNRLCSLGFVKGEDNKDYMVIRFKNGGTLKYFEAVEDICEDDYGVWVTTVSKYWRFDNI